MNSHKTAVCIISAHRPWAHQILNMVVIDLHCPVIQVNRQCLPTVQAVINRLGLGNALPLQLQPSMQILAKRFGAGLPDGQPIFSQ